MPVIDLFIYFNENNLQAVDHFCVISEIIYIRTNMMKWWLLLTGPERASISRTQIVNAE